MSDPTACEDPAEMLAQVVADFHLDHHRRSSTIQRAIDRVTAFISRPPVILVLIGLMTLWVGCEILRAGRAGPNFEWIDLWGTLTALTIALLILGTQRREDELADRRAKLMLELALLTETKNAKIIALLEEIRRDAPYLTSRSDPESDQLQTPADPKVLLEKLDQLTEAGRDA